MCGSRFCSEKIQIHSGKKTLPFDEDKYKDGAEPRQLLGSGAASSGRRGSLHRAAARNVRVTVTVFNFYRV